MSQPIKIVEGTNGSSEKNTNFYPLDSMNKNLNNSNFSFTQSTRPNDLCLSPSLNQNQNITSSSNVSIILNENKLEGKETNLKEFASFIKFPEQNFPSIQKESLIEILEKAKKTEILEEQQVAMINFSSQNELATQKDLDLIKDGNSITNKYSTQIINESEIITNFNNCPNKKENMKNEEIKESIQDFKQISDAIFKNLQSICEKYVYSINCPTQNVKNEKMNLETNSKNINKKEKEKSKDNILNLNLINKNEKNPNKIINPFSTKKNENGIENEREKINYLNKNEIINNNNLKFKKQGKNVDSNINTHFSHFNRVRNLKRINNRKFNIKSRGIKYNILTEEMKKKLLIDASTMRTTEVAKKYGISTRNVNRWKKKGIQRKKGSGRKFKDPRLERRILEWYRMQDKETLTTKEFKEKAIELSDNKTFRASSGWLTNMKRKYNLNFKKY